MRTTFLSAALLLIAFIGKGTGKRIRKDSFYWYKKCIESNGEDLA